MIKLAWRNIWRNKRRSIITMTSLFIALFFCIIMNAFSDGTWNDMIENTLKTQSGNIEIHGAGYWDDKTVDHFMTMDRKTVAELRALPNVENLSPRIETFAMASHAALSKGIALTGISPENEIRKQKLDMRLVRGSYLAEDDSGVLIGEGLAQYLRVDVGDTLALLGQGYRGASAAGLFPVRGILKLAIAEMNGGLAYLSLPAAQAFVDLPDGYSGLLVALENDKKLDETMQLVASRLPAEAYETLSWHTTLEQMLRTAETDKAFNKLVMYILYLIVGFGILGTVIMMSNERRREFAVMISLGMQRQKLKTVFALELLMMNAMAVAGSLLLTTPVVAWFYFHPILLTGEMAQAYSDMGMEAAMSMALESENFVTQIVIISVLSFATLIYSFRMIGKLNPTGRM
jgi:ABC-type lipoprotein release transport system permease subunit